MLLDSPNPLKPRDGAKSKIVTVHVIRGRATRRGQTLIIALIIMGLLLILGFVFLGIVDNNIKGGASAKVRSQSNDLAEAGIRFAQQQLVYSPAGADWRGTPTTLSPVPNTISEPAPTSAQDYTYDPDALYLRGPAGVDPNTGKAITFPGTDLADLGGPDGLGPFVRISYDAGRSLVRVRLGQSDANIFASSPVGPLRFPGKVHNYLIVEAVGREGVVNLNDPTTFQGATSPGFGQFGVQFQAYGSQAAFVTALSTMKRVDSQITNSRYLRALATTGLLDNARFITNKFNVNRAADVGYPNPYLGSNEVLTGLGVVYNGSDVGSQLTYTSGSTTNVATPATNALSSGFGSFYSNADVTFHGNLSFFLNDQLGDGIRVAGNILADDNANLALTVNDYSPATNQWTQQAAALNAQEMSSRSAAFNSNGGILLDGFNGLDASGNPRGVGRLVPPSILTTDPQTGTSRYLALTRDTMGAAGAQGHGNGIYISNTTDIQGPIDEAGRAGAGSSESPLYDYMNPNNDSPNSAWQGPFYIPPAATLSLRSDGFIVQLDSGTWPGLNTNTLRYRIGRYNGQLTIVDSAEDPTDINATTPNFAKGQAFNGVLYFEGNVRVRGMIPTDTQLTVVSGANVYIDGSITKGIIGNDVTDSYPTSMGGNGPYLKYGAILSRPSKSAIILMARDNVVVNTTQFVGLQTSQQPVVQDDRDTDSGYSPLIMTAAPNATNGELDLIADLNLDSNSGTQVVPNGGTEPSSQVPYAMEYVDSITGQILNSKLLLTHTMADGTGAAAFIGMNVNLGVGTTAESQYFFPGNPGAHLPANYPQIDNTASTYLQTGGTSIADYGLGEDSWQRFVKYESRGFDLIYPSASTYNGANGTLTAKNSTVDPFVGYTLLAPGSNDLLIRPASINGVPQNDYLLARAALVPGDIKIEASIFAEEGSFVVIPGPWFNPNPEDTRAKFTNDQDRLAKFGNAPEIPFYGEPIDVRVQIVGSVTENMPPPLSVQNDEFQKWGWIPVFTGSPTLNLNIPVQHNPAKGNGVVPNFTISYDPDIATGRIEGFSSDNSTGTYIRTDSYGRPLLPMPRLPVSPAFTFFGDFQ